MARRVRHEFFDEDFLLRLQRLHLIAKRMARGSAAGSRRSRRLGDGLEFADHRPYAPGDDIRFIDWPYYARMERLLLRMFHEHSQADVVILLDVSASMAPGGAMGKFDFARRAAAALAYVAMGSLESVTILAFSDDLGEAMHVGPNRDMIFGVLDFLAGLAPGGRTDLGRCVEQLTRRRGAEGTLLLLSDLLECEADLSDALARPRQYNCDVTVLHVYGPQDAAPALSGSVLLRQAENAEQMTVNVTTEVLESYRQRWREFQARCERTCVSGGARYVPAASDLPFDRLVLETLRRCGVLAG